MFILLFVFWLLLNGRFTVEVAVTGAVISLLIWLLSWRCMGLTPRKEWALFLRLWKWLGYLAFLAGQVILAGVQVIRLIWSPTLVAEPVLFTVRTRLKTRLGRVSLANSITLTPGTITVSLQDGRLLVHALDTDMAQGIEGGEMEKRLLAVEGGASPDA
ncbi:MAG: Na+/H+ antiporter subunit E [Clostridia bacterium]|nr:Na+/H+ antiporter subunit E [Clostridia bacterium]